MNTQPINIIIKAARSFLDVFESELDRQTPNPEPPNTSKPIEKVPVTNGVERKPRGRTQKSATTRKVKTIGTADNEKIVEDISPECVRSQIRIIKDAYDQPTAFAPFKEYGVVKLSDLTSEQLKELHNTHERMIKEIDHKAT